MMGKVIMSGIVPQLTVPARFKLDATFENNTWEAIVWACQENAVLDTWVVGDQKAMTINGTDYLIDIIGKNHDTYATGGTAPLTFQMHAIYNTTYTMHNSDANNWANSLMRTSHLPSILSKMPTEVKNSVKQVNKLTSAGNKSSTIKTTADKLFLLSEIELCGNFNHSMSGEGSQYAYYSAGNSKTKYKGTSASTWWLRSPARDYATALCGVREDGTIGQTGDAPYANGVSFAFCF